MSVSDVKCRECVVCEMNDPGVVQGKIFFKDGKLNNLNEGIVDLDGICGIEWRQGVKHDCAGVMELEKKRGTYLQKQE